MCNIITRMQRLLEVLHEVLPKMSLIASDFSYLPDVKIPGDRAPLVSTKVVVFLIYLPTPTKKKLPLCRISCYLEALWELFFFLWIAERRKKFRLW